MLTLNRTVTDLSQDAGTRKPGAVSLDAPQRARLRALLGQAARQSSQPLLDAQVQRWMPLAVPLLGMLLAASILLIWATVL